eukprot:TRINITY_DN30266_c0_g2_i1.p1 TRINITY_DN30266_c0_g2~~TRINITY_DN30266_c0_g2_i1.p1  ORF type:complete len:513 (+),score=86.67 TRINITY_DN30266_c0_g2_i1:113-1651(+)
MAPPAKKARHEEHDESKSKLLEVQQAIFTPALHWAMTHGLTYADKNPGDDTSRATQCPLSLLPLRIPRKAFEEAVAWSPGWGTLVDAVSRDLDWLYSTLEVAAQADPFTKKLIECCKAVQADPAGLRQNVYLGIHRSDYMMHEPEGTKPSDARFLQVELNTIASSFGALSSRTGDLHRFLFKRYARGSGKVAGTLREKHRLESVDNVEHYLPPNPTLDKIPGAMATAFEIYSKATPAAVNAVVVFVVQEVERNYADQRFLEHYLFEDHGIPVLRKTLREIYDETSLDAQTGRLRFADGHEIAVAYFRAGYTPEDYISELEWEARLRLEKSLAIKCPSVAYQLVGAKKVQQALARPGAVERFVDKETATKLRKSFAGLWGLGPGEDDGEIVRQAQAAPAKYVMKPQREGGGNNIYGEDIASTLSKLSLQERGAYILMQRIEPQPQEAILTRMGTATHAPALSEFGFYNVYVGDGRTVYKNEHAGHLVRTKAEGVDEGGVASGYAVLNSPFLVD